MEFFGKTEKPGGKLDLSVKTVDLFEITANSVSKSTAKLFNFSVFVRLIVAKWGKGGGGSDPRGSCWSDPREGSQSKDPFRSQAVVFVAQTRGEKGACTKGGAEV